MVASDAWERRAASPDAAVALMASALWSAAGCVRPADESRGPARLEPYTRADVDAIVLGADDALRRDDVRGRRLRVPRPAGVRARTTSSWATWWRTGSRSATWRCSSRADAWTAARRAADEPQHDRAGDHGAVPRRRRSRAVARALRRRICARDSCPARIDVPRGGLGDESFGLRGETPDGARGADVRVADRATYVLRSAAAGRMIAGAPVRGLADVLDGRT